jgi:hypothetical protein
MAFDDRSLNSYVDVAQRIADFRELHPDGSLQPLHLAEPWTVTALEGTGKDGKPFKATFIVYTAAAYRTPDDTRPGIGCAYEVFPGRTPYTAGSELQNAETAAWGRAIVAALASDSRAGVASREEVRNRVAEREPEARPRPQAAANGGPEVDEHGAATFAEQERMRTGPVPGTERLDGTPPGDPWHTVDENGERREPGAMPGPPPGPQAPRPRSNYAPPPGEIDEAAQQFADKAADCRTMDELDAVKGEANEARKMAAPVRSPEDGKTAALGVYLNSCRKAIREAEAAVT